MTREEFCRKAADIRYYDEIIAEYDRLVAEVAKVGAFRRDENNINADAPNGQQWYHCACGFDDHGTRHQVCLTHERAAAKLARAQAALRYYWDADHVKGWPTPCTCDFCTRFPQAVEELG